MIANVEFFAELIGLKYFQYLSNACQSNRHIVITNVCDL